MSWVGLVNWNIYCQENLINNPSGENVKYIPQYLFQVDAAFNWWNPNIQGSPDFYSSITDSSNSNFIPYNTHGFQEAKHGNYYFGFAVFDWNIFPDETEGCFFCRLEYLGGQFNFPLEKGKTYLFEFWMSRADLHNMKSSALDLFITHDTFINVYDFDNYSNFGYSIWSEEVPFEEKDKWVKVSACFQAKGGEKGFALGNFHDLTNIALIYPYPEGVSNDYRYFDDFSLIECPTCCTEQFPVEDQLTVYSSPSLDGTPSTLEMWLIPNSKGQLRIYDNTGRLVDNQDYMNLLNTYSFAGKAAGMYHYSFTTDLGYATYGKVLVGN